MSSKENLPVSNDFKHWIEIESDELASFSDVFSYLVENVALGWLYILFYNNLSLVIIL